MFVSNALGIFLLAAAWCPHQNNSLRAAGPLGMLQLEHAVHDFFGHILVRLVCVSYSDRALVDLLASLDVSTHGKG